MPDTDTGRSTGLVRFAQQRSELIGRSDLQGPTLCTALSELTDAWLEQLFDEACGQLRLASGVALLAVGGYGRGELAPFSDLDLIIVHDSCPAVDELAGKVWYPIWDTRLKLGHGVRTLKDTLRISSTDLDVATSMMTARVIAGDYSFAASLIEQTRNQTRSAGKRWLGQLHSRVVQRHAASGEVAFYLEPDLKEGLGGLRDIHALWWAIAAGFEVSPNDQRALNESHEVLTIARVGLHRVAKRAGDVLRLQDQDAVAESVGISSADELMAAIASAGRRVAWVADEAWARLDPPATSRRPPTAVAPGVQLHNGSIQLADDTNPATDPTLMLRVATAAARGDVRIDRASLDRLGEETSAWPDPWPAGASDDLVALLLEGERAIPVIESLDQRNLLVKLLPEWASVRSKPQRNAYHRYTVDRHLWQTAANAALLKSRVSRPDLLIFGALFHDLGKGYPGDHTEAGVKLFAKIGPRMGLSSEDCGVVSAMIEHHLLLPDVATRRDLADDATITNVAAIIRSQKLLELLHALTEADSLATGLSAWGSWKSELVQTLVDRVAHVLGGGDVQEVMWRLFPNAQVLELMAKRVLAIETFDDRITVVSPDRPGTFSKVAGVLTLHGLDVLGAEAHSDEQGMAASEFRVHVDDGDNIDWQPVVVSLERAMRGELALDARLAERAETYRRRRSLVASAPAPASVRFDDNASSNATFLEVRAPDKIGILRGMTKAIADTGLDIRHARIQTLGNEVIDSFYVRTADGKKVTDTFHRLEVERAILHAVA
ncbi:MAG: [protein-PII] uridylyltransferase [Ilumatobacteraceae bacterium]